MSNPGKFLDYKNRNLINPKKPLGHKGYGSIPHLSGSRLGPGDHSCNVGQETICLVQGRDNHDRVIVTEKLDGSNVCVARVGDEIVALNRAGYLATSSPHEQHHLFARWVDLRTADFMKRLAPGERFVGEWLAQAHGTRYHLEHAPFVIFDLMNGQDRLTHDECRSRSWGLTCAAVLHDGGPVGLDVIGPMLETSAHGAVGPAEGAVWRVERNGKFDFITKWVRHGKIDGSLIPDISGEPAVWNWHPYRS